MKDINILGFKVKPFTTEDLIKLINKKIKSNDVSARILQLNPEIAVAANYSKKISSLVNDADYLVCNGVGIQWAAYYEKNPGLINLFKSLGEIVLSKNKVREVIPNKFNSSSFTMPLLESLNNSSSAKVLIAGAPKNSTIQHTGNWLRSKFNNLTFIEFDTSNFNDLAQEKLINFTTVENPDLLLLGIGFPAQEKVAQELKSQLKTGVIITEGGTFDYEQFGGKIKRAPKWMQNIGLEWFWRLMQEPIRLKRQRALLHFIKLVYRNNKTH